MSHQPNLILVGIKHCWEVHTIQGQPAWPANVHYKHSYQLTEQFNCLQQSFISSHYLFWQFFRQVVQMGHGKVFPVSDVPLSFAIITSISRKDANASTFCMVFLEMSIYCLESKIIHYPVHLLFTLVYKIWMKETMALVCIELEAIITAVQLSSLSWSSFSWMWATFSFLLA